jgi:hypothetical protein
LPYFKFKTKQIKQRSFMRYILVILGLLVATGCSVDKYTEATVIAKDGQNGVDGKDGVSCTIFPIEGGAQLSCSDDSSVVIRDGLNGTDGQDGQDGQDGNSCYVEETEVGATITCGESFANIFNGQDGQDGEDGESAVATISNYSANSCTLISGTSSYVKKTGSSNYAFYTTSNCASNSKFAEVSQGEAYWLGPNVLGTHADGSLRVLTFN